MLQWKPYPEHLSHSQVKNIFDCGEKFRLERGYGIKFPPRWATVGGSGFHTISQWLDEAMSLGENAEAFWEDRAIDQQLQSVDNPLSSELFEGREADLERLLQIREERSALEVELGALASIAAVLPHTEVVSELWRVGFAHAIGEDLEGFLKRSPEFADEKLWRNSAKGKAGVKFPDGENKDWWNLHGPQMVQKYLHWRHTSGWTIPFAGTQPAIELDVSFVLPGTGIKVSAYLDRVMLDPAWSPAAATVVDIKTSRAVSKEPEQLGVYATALELLGLPRPTQGRYYDARKGVLSEPYALSEFTVDYFEWKYQNALYTRDNGLLQANTQSQFCRSCELSDWCYAKNGSKANEVPRPWVEAAERRRLSITPVDRSVDNPQQAA